MESSPKGEFILINKPYRWTSFDVVKKVKFLSRIKKVGHSGTLDPLATGLLVICCGTFTKKADEIQAKEKEYTGTFFLGAQTPSYDLETEPYNISSLENINEEKIHQATHQFIGKILQTAPIHSAKKVNGKRAYELAREGKEVILKPNEIVIREFEITNINLPEISFRVTCGKGTYIRSLAHDFGNVLGTGAYLSSLCRTRIGDYKLEDALSIEDLENRFKTK